VRRVAASAALALVLLDVTAVGVLLPTLRADLGSSPSGGQWVMNAYLLTLALALPLALQTRVDRRGVAALGALALAGGGVVCASADSTSTLVVGRALEGAGMGALIVPVTGVSAAGLPLAALALGPLVGGELAERNWWHLWFWAAVPVAALLAGAALLGEGRDGMARARAAQTARGRDLKERVRERRAEDGPLGAFTEQPAIALAALVGLVVVLVQSEPWGIASRDFWAIAAVTLALAVVLGWGAWAAAGGALSALCFLMPQYFELGHLIHPLRSGVRLSTLTIAAVAGGLLAWRLRSLVPRPVLAVLAALAAAAGAIALAGIDEQSGNTVFGLGLLLAGGGFGAAAGVAYDGELERLLPNAAVGAALTLAISGALFQHTQAELRAGGDSFEHALSRGAAAGALVLLGLAAALVVAAWVARPRSSAARPAAES
jgi:MFS family permease